MTAKCDDIDQPLKDQGNIDTTKLFKESIRYKDPLIDYINTLIKIQQIKIAFEILRKIILLNDSLSATKIIQVLIGAGINIGTYKYERVETPLHCAAREGNVKIVKFLIKNGVDVDIRNKNGATALHLAVINGHDEVVKELIQVKAKVNEKTNEGQTPLHLAVSCKDYKIVESLLKAGSNPNIFCPLGDDLHEQPEELFDIKCNPLQLAAFMGDIELINLLINHGADINAVCKNKKYSCLHMAVFGITYYSKMGVKEEGYLKILNSLLSTFPDLEDTTDHENNSLLHRAVSKKQENVIKILLRNKALLLQFRKGGYTPFHDAVSTRSLALVKLLLESSDEKEKVINSVYRGEGFSGHAPLHLAINDYINCLKQEDNRSNALEITRYLLSHPYLNINIQDFQGEIPLHYAVKYIKDDELALILINKLLIAKDINPFIKDSSGKTPFDYAKKDNRSKILQALINKEYGLAQNSLLHLVVENDDSKAIEYLIEEKIFDINLENDSGYSSLHLASREGNIEAIKTLLYNGAKIDQFAECGRTPLQIAGIEGCLDAVKLLLANGVDVNARGIDGTTIIHLVVGQYINLLHGNSDNDIEQSNILSTIKYLLNYKKLDINAQIDQKQFLDYTVNKKTVLHHLILNNVPIEQQNKRIGLIKDILNNRKINPFIKDDEGKTPIDYYAEQEKYNHPTLNRYVEIQEERNIKIEDHKTKKYIAYTLTLCAMNFAFAAIYTNQYILGNVTSDLSLIFIINVAVLVCCLIINKFVERSIETKYRNKVADVFNSCAQIEEQSNPMNYSDLPTPNILIQTKVGNSCNGGVYREQR